MSGSQHFLFALATLLTLMAPALTVPCITAWALMAWLGSATEQADVSSSAGCGLTMVIILFVGGAAILFVLVAGAALEGRL